MDDLSNKSSNDREEVLIGQENIFMFLQENKAIDQILPESAPQIADGCNEQNGGDSGFLFSQDGQMSFVDSDEWWKEHWIGMPEFIQEDAAPWKSMYIHFRSFEDLKEFGRAVAQRLTIDTPSIWFPEMPKEKRMHMGYVDES